MKPQREYPQPACIETPRLRLRPMTEADAPLVVAWRNEPDSLSRFASTQPITEAQHLQWFRGERRGRVDYVIERKDTGRPIGVLNFKNIDDERRSAESGRLIGDLSARGQGFASEAAVAWFRYGFEQLGLERIVGITRRDNAANIRLNQSLGYRPADLPGGVAEGFIAMELTRQEALAHPAFQRA